MERFYMIQDTDQVELIKMYGYIQLKIKDRFEYYEYIFVYVDDYMFLKSSLRA